MAAPTKLSKELLRLFANGEITSAAVQSLASAAWEDGWGHRCALSARLAKAGSNGLYSGNIARDVILAAQHSGLQSTKAHAYQVQLADGTQLDVLLPHEVYPALVGADVSPWCLSPDAEQGLRAFKRGRTIPTFASKVTLARWRLWVFIAMEFNILGQ